MMNAIHTIIENNSELFLVTLVVITISVGLFSTIIVGIIYTSEQEKCLDVAWRMKATVEYNTTTNSCRIGPPGSIDKITVE
jgi:hypothetical protein